MIDSDMVPQHVVSALCGAMTMEALAGETRTLLRDFSPVGIVCLLCVFPSRSIIELSAIADQHGYRHDGRRLGKAEEIGKTLQALGSPIQLARRASMAAAARPLIEQGIIGPDVSLIVVRLSVDVSVSGLLIVCAEPGIAFTAEHAQLVKTLRVPLIVGLRHSLQTGDLQRTINGLSADIAYIGRCRFDQEGSEVVGADRGLRVVMNEIRMAAAHDQPVILCGEPGVGRGLLARTIHYLSRRQRRPLLEFNGRLFPRSQHSAVLFGDHDESGAQDGLTIDGLFARADTGTVVIRGIENMSKQAVELLQSGSDAGVLRRCGPHARNSCSVRLLVVVEDAEQLPAAWRPAARLIRIPPLRERREDIPRLIQYFLERAGHAANRQPVPELDRASLDRCLAYDWPGNVTELRGVIERAALISSGGALLPETLPIAEERGSTPAGDGKMVTLDQLVAEHITRALHFTGGKVAGPHGAASLLGVNPSTLRKRMRKLHIPFGRKAGY